MSVQITVEIPEEALSALKSTPANFAKEMRLAAVVKWYEMGKISQAKAAEIAGISRQEFLETLNYFKVSPFQITKDELYRELENV